MCLQAITGSTPSSIEPEIPLATNLYSNAWHHLITTSDTLVSPLHAIADVPKRTKRPKRNSDPEGPIQEESSNRAPHEVEDSSASSSQRTRIDKKEWPPYLRDTLVENAKQAGYEKPTSIQRNTMSPLMKGKDVMMHAETGSGKTLAFLMPIISRSSPDTPFQTMILVPSRELAIQTAQVVTELWDLGGEAVGVVVPGAGSIENQHRKLLKTKPAIIVGSVKQLDKLLESPSRRDELLANLRVVVLDEVDALLPPRPKELMKEVKKVQQKQVWKELTEKGDRSRLRQIKKRRFEDRDIDLERLSGKDRRLIELKPAQKILSYINLKKNKMQLACASATAESSLMSFLNLKCQKYNSFEKMTVVSSAPAAPPTKGLRVRGVAGVSVPARIRHSVQINVDGDVAKKYKNILAAYREDQPWAVIMAVGNKESVSTWVIKLRASGIPNAEALHEALGFGVNGPKVLDAEVQIQRLKALQDRFKSHTGTPPFIVATQANLRGIDLKGVDVVYLTAAPTNTNEYQHLAGRSGRQGRSGKCISFLDQSDVPELVYIKSDLGIKMQMTPQDLIPRWEQVYPLDEK
uniref:RNA helicase n=1 Tax=Eutreptiella gymnastica TaxID=73025 RepID=A0A7S1N315_9EUGL